MRHKKKETESFFYGSATLKYLNYLKCQKLMTFSIQKFLSSATFMPEIKIIATISKELAYTLSANKVSK